MLRGMNCYVVSAQTYVRRIPQVPRFDLAIVDECHHAAKGSIWDQCLEHGARGTVLGVTATPCRLDGRPLGDVFDDMVLGPTPGELIARGALSPYRLIVPQRQLDLSSLPTRMGDFVRGDAEAVVDKPAITGDAIEHYQRFVPGGQAVAFCVSIAHAQHVAEEFNAAGIRAASIDGKMDRLARRAVVADFAAGKVQVLTSADVISEGFDVPGIEAAILLRPTKSLSLYLQQCLDDETEILTSDGWKRRDQVNEGDIVAAFNIETEQAEWKPVIRKVERQLAPGEKMFAIKSPHLDIRVTGGHDMVVRSRSRTTKRWMKDCAESVAKRATLFKIPVSGTADVKDAPLADDEIRFIGWFLTDGSKNKKTNAVTIAQSSAKESHCAEIRRVLASCGFKFGEHRSVRKGKFAGYPDLIHFYVSRGKPRGTGKHLRGYEAVEAWLDKNIGNQFEALSARQLEVLIEAMNLGDGANGRKTLTWTPRTMTIAFGDNREAAERFQALCVMRGFRCNIASFQAEGRNRWWSAHVKKSGYSTIAGVNCKNNNIDGKRSNRSRFVESDSVAGEIVWCVENSLGTLFIRRNGKVAVVGNCGRALRTSPGKSHAVILDHVGNAGSMLGDQFIWNHGLPDDEREWSLEGRVGQRQAAKAEVQPGRRCMKCLEVVRPGVAVCPNGHPLPVQARKVEQVAGSLGEVNVEEVKRTRPAGPSEKLKEQAAARSLEALIELGRIRGYANPEGWARHLWDARTRRRA